MIATARDLAPINCKIPEIKNRIKKHANIKTK